MLKILKPSFAILAVVFLLAPLLAIMPLAFTSSVFLTYPLPGVSLRWFDELLTADAWRRAIGNTLVMSVGTALLATVLGTLAALGLRGKLHAFEQRVLVREFLVEGFAVAQLAEQSSRHLAQLLGTQALKGLLFQHHGHDCRRVAALAPLAYLPIGNACPGGCPQARRSHHGDDARLAYTLPG